MDESDDTVVIRVPSLTFLIRFMKDDDLDLHMIRATRALSTFVGYVNKMQPY